MDSTAIRNDMKALCLLDADIKKAYDLVGLPPGRTAPTGFKTFLFTIVSQQLSTKVAEVIQHRVELLLETMTPEGILSLSDQQLRDAGLSWRKIEYSKGLSQAIVEGSFDIDTLERLSDEEAITAITKIRGFGRWSAEIYLMFSLQRSDIFPADDLGILIALGQLKSLPDKPTAKQARSLTEHWAPYRSVAALFLWHYYHHPMVVNRRTRE